MPISAFETDDTPVKISTEKKKTFFTIIFGAQTSVLFEKKQFYQKIG